MNMQSTEMKARSAAAALGSLRAEGLTPSPKTQKRVQQYVQGKVSAQELRKAVVQEVRNRNQS